jgi:hypothetical protein
MAALVVVALFWGNCFSCPEVLLAAQKHSCCPHGKADPSECKTQVLRDFVKAEKAAPVAPPTVVTAAVIPALPVMAALDATPLVTLASLQSTPPDLLPLRI